MEPVRVEQFGLGDPRIRELVALPWRLYRGDPCWTPPLDADYLGSRLLGITGLLTQAHPYHRSAEVTHFIARRGTRAVGRVTAAVNHRFNEYHGVRLGFFGFFECEPDERAATHLLDAAFGWCEKQGVEAMRGPGEYSNATHERQGVLVDGFDEPPTVECTHNPPYYAELLEAWGLRKAMDYHAYRIEVSPDVPDRLARLAEAVRRRTRIETRPADPRRFDEEVATIVRIYNRAWSSNWGFLPITEAEARDIAQRLRAIADPGLVRFAMLDGTPVAVLGAFPDPNWALRPRWGWAGDGDLVRLARLLASRGRIPRARLMFFGVLPGYRLRGVDAVLFEEAYRYGAARGYTMCEASLLLENNELIIRSAESLGGRRYKTWRIYERRV